MKGQIGHVGTSIVPGKSIIFYRRGPQGTAALKRQRNAISSFPQRIGSDRAVGSVLPACVSLRNTLRWQSQEAARTYVAESSLPLTGRATEVTKTARYLRFLPHVALSRSNLDIR